MYKDEKQKTFHLFLTVVITVILTVLFVAPRFAAAHLKVKMLDVAQGDSFLIQTDNENILIDTADSTARNRLMYYLQLGEVETIDKLILTHPHADHIANAAYLINQGYVRAVFDNGRASANIHYRNYIQACKAKNIPRYTLYAGDTFFLDDGAYLEILSANRFARYENNNCVVARLVYGNFSMIFTGDAEAELEDELFQNVPVLNATVLKAAHHGSKTSNTLDFVQAVQPEYVFISAKINNSYGHPHKAALENFLLAGVDKHNIYWTAKNGAVAIVTDGDNFSIEPEFNAFWLDEYLHYKLDFQTIWSDNF